MNEKTTTKRGGRRPGAGRKPNYMKRLAGAAALLARRDPRLAALTEEEFYALEGILKKLCNAAPDAPQNQIESNKAIEEAEVVSRKRQNESGTPSSFRRLAHESNPEKPVGGSKTHRSAAWRVI